MTAAEKTFREIFDYSSDLIYIQDFNGVFLNVNKAVLDSYGYSKREIIGRTPEFLSKPGKNNSEKINLKIQSVARDGEPQRFEWWGLKKNGEEFLKEVVLRKGHYFDREVIIATARDITKRKKSEERLKKKNQELKKMNAALDAFVYTASHDLKAPLSSLKGLLDLMKRDDPKNAGEYINQMEKSINKLNQFIVDLVDYSRNAKTDVQITKININDKVRQLVDELKYSEHAGPIEFDLQLNAPNAIYTDNLRVEVILSNLISNSICYHDSKKLRQFVIIKSAVKGENLLLEVIDNGIGIAPEHQDKIFDMFFRATDTNKSGSGIGLFMVKEAVELLEGTIRVESRLDEGTAVKVTLPIRKNGK